VSTHCQIATHSHASPTDKPDQIDANPSKASFQSILNAMIKPYIAITSMSAIRSIIKAIIFPLFSGFSSIALSAHHTNFPIHIQAPSDVNQIESHAQIGWITSIDSFPRIWNAITKPYIADDSTRATQRIVIVRKNVDIF
jgi:hypothetical protein